MDLGSLFSGPAPAGPQTPAVSAGFTPGAGASPDAAAPGAFGSLVDLALAQLAGGGDAPAAAPGVEASRSAPVADDADAADRAGDEPQDAPVDALGLSVLIALATPVVVPPAAVASTPVSDGATGADARDIPIGAGDRPSVAALPVVAEGASGPVAAPAPDGAFEAALEGIAAEEPAAGAAPIEAPAHEGADVPTGPVPSGTPAPVPAHGATPRASTLRAAKPSTDAIAPAPVPVGSPVAEGASQSPGATPAPTALPIADAGPDPAGRSASPLRGAASVAAPIAIEPRQAAANGATGFGDASSDASAGERFVPSLSTGRAAPAAGRTTGIVAGNGETAPSIEAAAPLNLATAVPGAPVLRAIDAPVPAARFEHALAAAADPETRNLQAMVRTVRLFTAGDGGGEARLQLEPDHLGPVALTVRVEQGSVSAHFRAETPAAQRWIETHQQELRAGLRDQGLEVKEVVVTTDPDGRRDRQQEPQPRRPRARREHADAPRFEVLV